jgi:mono/diheme cytochrome c family protein
LRLSAVLVAASTAGASAQVGHGDPARGEILVREQCVSCHAIGLQEKASQQGPSLTAVAQMPSTTSLSLHAFLLTSHPSMPNYKLETEEVDDIVSFVLNLRSH